MGGSAINARQAGQLFTAAQMAEAAQSAGLTLDPLSGMYYQPKTGQFYQSAQKSIPFRQTDLSIQSLMGRKGKDTNVLNAGGYTFNPFTGNAPGITGGLFSPIGRFEESPQTFEAPVGILNALFGGIDFSGSQSAGPSYGAGRFLGTSK